MSQNSRPKRGAALKTVAIIEISDSEDEFHPSPAKKCREDASNRTFDEAANGVERTKKQRWPDKEKKTRSKKSTKKSPAEKVTPTIRDATEDDGSGQCPSSTYETQRVEYDGPPARLPSTNNGRSSFWERRKVWNIHELLAETESIDTGSARNIVQLFENENTIPFICRYRRDLVNHITPERLRDIKNSYGEIVGLRKKAETIVTQLEKENVIDEGMRHEMLCAKTTEELEFLYAPYKPASKGSLAERAKALGLQVYADRLLYGEAPIVQLQPLVQYHNPDLNSVDKVLTGICHIIAHNISKHTSVLEELRCLQKVHRILIKSTKTKTAVTKDVTATKSPFSNKGNNKNDSSKFETYFTFEDDVRRLKAHQVLAINRGEKLKCLNVKLLFPEQLKTDMQRFISSLYMHNGLSYELRRLAFDKAFEECYTKKLQPLLTRQIRSDLNEMGRKASIDVFANNLKQLLLMSPLKGERILGIDPGFTNGCKLAVISETADVLETGVIYPHTRRHEVDCDKQLVAILQRHCCNVIAVGNGTGCRETEFWLTKLFKSGVLDGRHVRYSIVSEQGASVYSCSDLARKEFPTMDMNEISAVSIARRLNDPLSEYVKIDPRHIGVGMYQHDVNEKMLSESLNEVVSECVSYVGVDINTASFSLLKNVAGLSAKKAEKILQYRMENGCFRTRKDLLLVKSIGDKTFIQCAGFIRIDPLSVGGKLSNPLDSTWVHPESYDVAKALIRRCGLHLTDIGTPGFISKIGAFAKRYDLEHLAQQFTICRERFEVILEALQRKLTQDYRADFDKRPLFKQGVTRLTDLSVGEVVTGAVTNVTHFGAFCDIGVETDGLIHTSKMNNAQLNVGDRVTASITQLDIKRKRIGLRLEDMLLQTDTSFTFA